MHLFCIPYQSQVPVVVLNIMNWNWDILLDMDSKKTMQQVSCTVLFTSCAML